jgi:Putative transmembrane protein (PGPGW)
MCTAGNGVAGWRGHLRICGGFLALFIGLILAIPGVPGPGILLILLGLMVLSSRFVWAKRMLEWCKRTWKHVRLK